VLARPVRPDEVLRSYPERIVAIVGDDLRGFHPAYEDLMDAAPASMPDATAQASGAWVRMAIDYALEHRISVAVEGTFRRPELTLGEAERFHAAGFHTHLVALSVPAAVSRLSTLARYVTDHRESGHARWTPLDAHDAGYAGTPRTVAAAEVSPAIDRISVYNRAGVASFDRSRSDGPLSGAASAVEIGRMAPMGELVALRWLRDFHNDVGYLREHGEVTRRMAPLLVQLSRDAENVLPIAHPDVNSASRRDARNRIHAEQRSLDGALLKRGPAAPTTALGPQAPAPEQNIDGLEI
jgi:UDP-N-acetylglucosamine kinase